MIARDAWHAVCDLEDILPDTGVCALIDDRQIAVFRVGDEVCAIDNGDPASGANVLSRGIVGDFKGELVVASPLYKHHYSLRTGRCLEDPDTPVSIYPARVTEGFVWVNAKPYQRVLAIGRRRLVVIGEGMAGMQAIEELIALAPDSFETELYSSGEIPGSESVEALMFRDRKRGVYKRLVIHDSKLQGAVLYGDARDGPWYFDLITTGCDITALRDNLLFGPAAGGAQQ